MIPEDRILPDNIDDPVGRIIEAFAQESGWLSDKPASGWTAAKERLRKQMIHQMIINNYIAFVGSSRRYHISQIGASYLTDIAMYKCGALKQFRGKRVRIVCVGSGRYTRNYMAGTVGDTPEDLRVQKRSFTYEFPDFVTQSELVYKGRRFILFKPRTELTYLSVLDRDEVVDMTGWDSVLYDGKLGAPVAKFRHNADGSYSINGSSWEEDINYASIPEAIDEIRKDSWSYQIRL